MPIDYTAPFNNALAGFNQVSNRGLALKQNAQHNALLERKTKAYEDNALAQSQQSQYDMDLSRRTRLGEARQKSIFYAQKIHSADPSEQERIFNATGRMLQEEFGDVLPTNERQVWNEETRRATAALAGLGDQPEESQTDIGRYAQLAEAEWGQQNPGAPMPPSKKMAAMMRFKRAQADEAGAIRGAQLGQDLAVQPKIEAAKTGAKLDIERRLRPAVEFAVTQATKAAEAQAKTGESARSNKTAWNVYNAGMGELMSALSGTRTGPGVDWLPAVTASAQIAEGAGAAMAPVLKQMFRAAGEGVFTDRDQALLMGMIPDRGDHPEAAAAKVRMIDAIVKAKLNLDESSEGQTKAIRSQAEYDALPSGATYIEDGQAYRKP